MSRECVRAVIAHELGHLSGLHSQFSGRIYRVSEMWGRLASNADGAAGNVLVRRFVLWYAPRLQARAFALRRANEYEADAASVLITGSSETARLLIGIHARGRSFTRESERRIANMVREGGETPPGFATAACLIAKEPLQMGDAERALDLMVLEETDYFDTHPCLLDRLESIGYESTPADARTLFEQKGLWPIHFEKFAADEYLPGGDAELVRRLDDSMRKKEFVSAGLNFRNTWQSNALNFQSWTRR
jgi:Zn-dependent protease with chaperone function